MRALALALALLAAPAAAVEPDEVLDDPVLEARARGISKELRCVVCRNQSIDDSDAGLAKDLRLVVRERLVAGDTDGEVFDYVTARYGDYVLLRPRFDAQSAVLYLGGPLLLVAGGLLLWRRSRRAVPDTAPPAPLNEAEKARLAELEDG